MRVAFDMSGVLWSALLASRDTENGYEVAHPEKADKKVWINSAKYGYENAINHMVTVLKQFQLAPIDMIMVFEGMHSKKPRRMVDPSYKDGDKRPPEAYVEFEALSKILRETWGNLGATTIQQDYVESDDVLAYLARESEQDLLISTGDRDLTILNGVNAYGSKIGVRCGDHKIGTNPYGAWDINLIPVYKALVGDSGDNIKGVVGFGDAKWVNMLVAYGEEGMFQIQDLLEKTGTLGDLHQQVAEDKLIAMICAQEAQCYRSFVLGKLHPEWVNTVINPLNISAGMVKPPRGVRDERLQLWYGTSQLVTSDNYAVALADLPWHFERSPFVTFDIETSTSDESDEWIERQSKTDDEGGIALDVFGSELTGFSLTFGANQQYTLYFSIDHADTNNITMEQARKVLELIPKDKRLVIQNFSFEASVCYGAFAEYWQDNGYHGFLPNMLDTKFEASYVDENSPLGLKQRSLSILKYKQQSYDETTLVKGPKGSHFPGGKLVREYEDKDPIGEVIDNEIQYGIVYWEDRRYKMRELPATHVFGYGCDDTICTSALHVYNRLVMELEHTWQVYLKVEIDAAYQHAVNFQCGMSISVEKINELAEIDDKTYADSWTVVKQFLIDNRFEGTEAPLFAAPLAAADVKVAFESCYGRKLDTLMRTPAKLITFIREVAGEPTFALLIDKVFKAEKTSAEAAIYQVFNDYVAEHFTGEPEVPVGSPKKMGQILFEVMKLPVRVRNKATDVMRAKGIFEGNPKTDALAIEYAVQMDATETQKVVLEALKLMQMVKTRRGLFYSKYPNFMHWKDGLVRPNHNQCAANTRRATESRPNKTQLPKHQKIEGQASRFREAIVPHKRGAVVVSMDFKSQELVIIADYSKDANLVACYVGENKKDVHALTGLGIFNYKTKKREGVHQISYEEFEEIRAGDKTHPLFQFVKEDRNLGKKTNFTTEFGAMAPKVAQTLLISEEEAQAFIDAREAMFPGVKQWKEKVIEEAKSQGYVTSMCGARRHLLAAFTSGDAWQASKAERQAVNYKVQGSAAEQTKLAEGRMWKENLCFEFDCSVYGPVHDEVVASVMIEDLPAFLPRMHACMVADFANMQVPIGSSISFGPDFYRQIEIGDSPAPEAIAEGILKLKEEAYQ